MHDADGSVEIIVKLVPGANTHALQACAARLGVSLQPLHPSAADRVLATYFVTRVASGAVEGVLAQLRQCDGVDAAYAKPRGEAP